MEPAGEETDYLSAVECPAGNNIGKNRARLRTAQFYESIYCDVLCCCNQGITFRLV